MNLLAPLAALLGIEVERTVHQAKTLALIYGLIGLSFAIAFGFLVAAGYIATAQSLGPIQAALTFAAGFVVLGGVFLLGLTIGNGRRRQQVARKRRSSETGALITTVALTALPAVLKSPAIVKLGIPAAAIAAFALLRDNHDDKQD